MVASGMPWLPFADTARRDMRRRSWGIDLHESTWTGDGPDARRRLRFLTVRPCERLHKVGRPGSPGQSRPQAFLADPPEVVLDPVDQGDRDLVPVLLHIRG